MKLRREIKKSLATYKNYRDSVITTDEPCKKLTKFIHRKVGRNNQGYVTVRHKGSGAKKLYREVSFIRKYFDIEGIVKTVEYDPFRTAFISLIEYEDKSCEYILNTTNLKVGNKVICSKQNKVPIEDGCCSRICDIPVGTIVHNVELIPMRGAKMARSAGSFVTVVDHVGDYTIIKLPSGSMRKIKKYCMAVIGQVSNANHQNRIMYKAGQNRHRGIRPSVRGVAMNPVDHPHGGGEGKTGTKRHPVSYTAKLTKGKKTANNKRPSRKFIIKGRKTKK